METTWRFGASEAVAHDIAFPDELASGWLRPVGDVPLGSIARDAA